MSLAWLVDPPKIQPPTGPASRVHLLRDDEGPAPAVPALAPASAAVTLQAVAAAIPRPVRSQAARARRRKEREAAERGECFLPLEPGQKRRRRAGPDGQPLKRGGRGQGGYVRPARASTEPREIPSALLCPAPAAMTYEQAIEIRQRARERQPVSREALVEANRIVQELRAEVRALLARESYAT